MATNLELLKSSWKLVREIFANLSKRFSLMKFESSIVTFEFGGGQKTVEGNGDG
jgi:hypothetical protein